MAHRSPNQTTRGTTGAPPEAERFTVNLLKTDGFPKASGLWRVQGGALALLAWTDRQQQPVPKVSNVCHLISDVGHEYCRRSGLVQYATVQFYMAGPSAPTSVRTWSSPLHTMRSAFRGGPACSIPPSASCSALWSRRLRCHSARSPSSPMCCACALRPYGRSCATALTDRKHQGAVAAVREVRSLTHADAAAWVGRGK